MLGRTGLVVFERNREPVTGCVGPASGQLQFGLDFPIGYYIEFMPVVEFGRKTLAFIYLSELSVIPA